ncbi:MAG: CapA family protein, partial [Deltaproteobacteria bacterium]|nr:CapA family protein [Deltaproteobacteria bacterium]
MGDTVPQDPQLKLGDRLLNLLETCDLRVMNLEGAMSETREPLFKAGTHLLLDPSGFLSLAKVFNVAVLANNHAMDFGVEG